MAKSATTLARELLDAGAGGLEELRVHMFDDDEAAHDDEATQALYAEFVADFDRCVNDLSQEYGPPGRRGEEYWREAVLIGLATSLLASWLDYLQVWLLQQINQTAGLP